jgi:hypothetical protein
MHTGKGQILELLLEDGYRYARVACPPNMVPAPGQYLLAGDGSDSPLPVPLFYTDSALGGFVAAAPIQHTWNPGLELNLRGPLGHGYTLPVSARKVGLVAFDDTPGRMKGLIRQSLKQEAALVLVCNFSPENLPDEVEVQPISSLREIVQWADYIAFDVARENLPQMKEKLGNLNRLATGQILIRSAFPCGGIADCGVCAVILRSGWKLSCKDGPVFDWREIPSSLRSSPRGRGDGGEG